MSLPIPESVATIEDAYRNGSSRTIYLLQDAHTNESGQLNLAKTLDILLGHEKGLKYVFTEAAAGDNSLSFLRPYTTLKFRQQHAQSYIRKGILHGEEYLDLTSDRDMVLWGVEDMLLYGKTLEAYRSVAQERDRFGLYLKKIDATIETLKDRLFNPSLARFDSDLQKYQKEEMTLTQYFTVLWRESRLQNIDLTKYPHLKNLDELKTREDAIDFAKANEEQAQALNSLSQADQDELKDVARSQKNSPFKLGSSDSKEGKAFYALLQDRLKGGRYPELSKYFSYLELSKTIEAKNVLSELNTLETEILDTLSRTEDERTLVKCQKILRHLKKLFAFTLTPEEFKEYQDLSGSFNIEHLTGFLNKKIMDLGTYYERSLFLEKGHEEMVKNAEVFYALTYERDLYFVKEMLSKMDEQSLKHAALITGGFHTTNLKALLRDKHISFISITPQVLKETNMKRYEEILLGQKMMDSSKIVNVAGMTAKHARTFSMITGARSSSVQEFFRPLTPTEEARTALRTRQHFLPGARLATVEEILRSLAQAIRLDEDATEADASMARARLRRASQDSPEVYQEAQRALRERQDAAVQFNRAAVSAPAADMLDELWRQAHSHGARLAGLEGSIEDLRLDAEMNREDGPEVWSELDTRVLSNVKTFLVEANRRFEKAKKLDDVAARDTEYLQILKGIQIAIALPQMSYSSHHLRASLADDLTHLWLKVGELQEEGRIESIVRKFHDNNSLGTVGSEMKKAHIRFDDGEPNIVALDRFSYTPYQNEIWAPYLDRETLQGLITRIPISMDADGHLQIPPKIGRFEMAKIRALVQDNIQGPSDRLNAYAKIENNVRKSPEELNSIAKRLGLPHPDKATLEGFMGEFLLAIRYMKWYENWEIKRPLMRLESGRSFLENIRALLGLEKVESIDSLALKVISLNIPFEVIQNSAEGRIPPGTAYRQRGDSLIRGGHVRNVSMAGGGAARWKVSLQELESTGILEAKDIPPTDNRQIGSYWVGEPHSGGYNGLDLSIDNASYLASAGVQAPISFVLSPFTWQEVMGYVFMSVSARKQSPDIMGVIAQNSAYGLMLDGNKLTEARIAQKPLGHGNVRGIVLATIEALKQGVIFDIYHSGDNPFAQTNIDQFKDVVGRMAEQGLAQVAFGNWRSIGQLGGGFTRQNGLDNVVDINIAKEDNPKAAGYAADRDIHLFATMIHVFNNAALLYAVSPGITVDGTPLITWDEVLSLSRQDSGTFGLVRQRLEKITPQQEMTMTTNYINMLTTEFVPKEIIIEDVKKQFVQWEQLLGMLHGFLPQKIRERQKAEGITSDKPLAIGYADISLFDFTILNGPDPAADTQGYVPSFAEVKSDLDRIAQLGIVRKILQINQYRGIHSPGASFGGPKTGARLSKKEEREPNRIRLPWSVKEYWRNFKGGWEATKDLHPHFDDILEREKRIVDRLHRFIREDAGHPVTILEIAAGKGRLFYSMARLDGVEKIVGMDINPESIQATRQKLENDPAASAKATVFQGDIYDPSVQEKLPRADVIVIHDTLMHLPDLEGVLDLVQKKLKPGGIFFGNINATEGAFSRPYYFLLATVYRIVPFLLNYSFSNNLLDWMARTQKIKLRTFALSAHQLKNILEKRFDVEHQSSTTWGMHEFIVRSDGHGARLADVDEEMKGVWAALRRGSAKDARHRLEALKAKGRIIEYWDIDRGETPVGPMAPVTPGVRQGTPLTSNGMRFLQRVADRVNDIEEEFGLSTHRERFDLASSGEFFAEQTIENIWKYAERGFFVLLYALDTGGKQAGLRMVAMDQGKGMTDIRRALQYGYSESGTQGLGLSHLKTNFGDKLEIESIPGEGTWVSAQIRPISAQKGARLAATESSDAIQSFLKQQSINFDPRFNHRVQILLKKPVEQWGTTEKKEYTALREEAAKASDWMSGWIKRSKYYDTFKGHPATLLSMEGIISAVEKEEGPRLNSYHGGLGVLFGEWIRAIAYLGGTTTLRPDSEAPEFTIFIPDYEFDARTSRITGYGYQESGAKKVARPENYGIQTWPDPAQPTRPFETQVPLDRPGSDVKVRYRLVDVGSIRVVMPSLDHDGNNGMAQRIFEELYKGKLSSRERFEQEWVAGLAAYQMRKKLGLPMDGPIHLNETATFPYIIAMIRDTMEKGYSYEEALEIVGGQVIFFTHTLVSAGIDFFNDSTVRLGDYIRNLFMNSEVPEVKAQADNVANWMIHGKPTAQNGESLKVKFEVQRVNGEFYPGTYSPLQFLVRLTHAYGGSVVAVSQLNAMKADEFFGPKDQGILTEEEIRRSPTIGITNGVDHLFWLDSEILRAMNWSESDMDLRTPERILDPADREAGKLVSKFERDRAFIAFAQGGETAISDEAMWRNNRVNKIAAIGMIRRTVQRQYRREMDAIEQRLADRIGDAHKDMARLHVLRVRMARWIGKEHPEAWVSSWESDAGEAHRNGREDLYRSEAWKLLDEKLFLGDWARRIVGYKRMLFIVFGRYLPEVEEAFSDQRALSEIELGGLVDQMLQRDASPAEPFGAFSNFVRLVVDKKQQFVFAGKTFDKRGESSIALLHIVIEKLSEKYPEIQNRVIFLEGYDETKSQYMLRGNNTWINSPERPMEASGTSGMKSESPNTFASPDGDGWSAGGIEYGSTGFVKPVSSDLPKEHPRYWPESTDGKGHLLPEWWKAPRAARYLREEADHFYSMMADQSAHFEDARAYFNGDTAKRIAAIDWVRGIRRWIYFTAMAYDIRGEFTGRIVPSFRPEDIPGGVEIGIFDLYKKAIENRQASEQRLAGARLADVKNFPGKAQHPLWEKLDPKVVIALAQDEYARHMIDEKTRDRLITEANQRLLEASKQNKGARLAMLDTSIRNILGNRRAVGDAETRALVSQAVEDAHPYYSSRQIEAIVSASMGDLESGRDLVLLTEESLRSESPVFRTPSVDELARWARLESPERSSVSVDALGKLLVEAVYARQFLRPALEGQEVGRIAVQLSENNTSVFSIQPEQVGGQWQVVAEFSHSSEQGFTLETMRFDVEKILRDKTTDKEYAVLKASDAQQMIERMLSAVETSLGEDVNMNTDQPLMMNVPLSLTGDHRRNPVYMDAYLMQAFAASRKAYGKNMLARFDGADEDAQTFIQSRIDALQAKYPKLKGQLSAVWSQWQTPKGYRDVEFVPPGPFKPVSGRVYVSVEKPEMGDVVLLPFAIGAVAGRIQDRRVHDALRFAIETAVGHKTDPTELAEMLFGVDAKGAPISPERMAELTERYKIPALMRLAIDAFLQGARLAELSIGRAA